MVKKHKSGGVTLKIGTGETDEVFQGVIAQRHNLPLELLSKQAKCEALLLFNKPRHCVVVLLHP